MYVDEGGCGIKGTDLTGCVCWRNCRCAITTANIDGECGSVSYYKGLL